ncbi:MAG: hypothetical protein HZB67_01160 [Candidatus Aenigmarchaeota archaeon]|nr:hypothetical protein [Candidatus Aenigmarchaeota archaeon]
MPKKKLSDMVFQRISPPDEKANLTAEDLSKVMVRRLGLKRKESRANHAMLLVELLKYRKENIPIGIDKMAQILNVSQSQTYEEIRKWRTLGLLEFVKVPTGEGFIKGYMLTAPTMNRLLDKTESSIKGFMRKTRRIAKDFDDLTMLSSARAGKEQKEEVKEDVAEINEATAESTTNAETTETSETAEESVEEEKTESSGDLLEKPIHELDSTQEEERSGE